MSMESPARQALSGGGALAVGQKFRAPSGITLAVPAASAASAAKPSPPTVTAPMSGSKLGFRSFPIGINITTYTGVFNDSYPYVVRACEEGFVESHCTPWF